MSHNLDPPDEASNDPSGRLGEGFKRTEFQLQHPSEPSCSYRTSLWRGANGNIKTTLAVKWLGEQHLPPPCTVLPVDTDFMLKNVGKGVNIREREWFRANGITDRSEQIKVQSQMLMFTTRGENAGTPHEEWSDVFRMVVDQMDLVPGAETGTFYRIYNPNPGLFVHGKRMITKSTRPCSNQPCGVDM